MSYLEKIYRKLRSIQKHVITRLRYGHLQKTIIIVYSMGKVASTTLYNTLKKKLPSVSIFHVHFLSDFWLNEKLPQLDSFYHGQIELGRRILKYRKRNSDKRLKIITLVREPIIREISGIFENAHGIFDKNVNLCQVDLTKEMDKRSFDFALNWFDSEFRGYLGFDIYHVPFDKERGYSIYRCAAADILCIKAERLNAIYSEALKEFFGIGNLALHNSNTSDKKEHKELYNSLRKSYKLPTEKLKPIYESKYMTHFYTAEEINGFIATWQKTKKG